MVNNEIVRRASEDSPRGFATFYVLIHNQTPPKHAMEWIEKAYEAKAEGKGCVIEAFRGSTKSTTFNTFVAFRTGQNPKGSSLIIRASEAAGWEAGEKVADIILNNPAWKLVFPNVIPDKDKGWGLRGYEVKDAAQDYESWRRLNSDRMDPSLLAVPYQANSIIGMHPSNVLLVDDIHTEDNTSSERELARVRKLLTGTIFPTRRPNDPWTIFIGTPWVKTDVLQAVKATGEYLWVKTPVFLDDGETPRWPEGMGMKQIQSERKQDITGGAEFARMFLLDLEAAGKRVFKYHLYPNHLINSMWIGVGGVDYASVLDPTRRASYHSHFALAYVLKRPEGGAVIFDGVLEQCSQADAEDYIDKAQLMFPAWQGVVMEELGKGDDFFQMLYRKPHVKLMPMPRGKLKSKADRLAREMGPWLENGRVRISDGESKFLNNLRRFFNEYPNVSAHDPGWDAADAVYWALRAMPDVLIMPDVGDEVGYTPRVSKPNPFASLGE